MTFSAFSGQDVSISSPMPGEIVKVLAHDKEFVQKGQPVFIVESMKILHELHVPKSGTIENITVTPGEMITPEQCLASLV